MKLLHGDCLSAMTALPDNSVDAIVTDPPYGLSFMGKKWDHSVPSVEVWREALRILKPGGHMLVACGTRTQHRMVVNIEDAGFEIRDVITWLYGQGFPKSLDISKAIDKAAGAEREVVGQNPNHRGESQMKNPYTKSLGQNGGITAPSTDAAKKWQGFGTALKPACEFWTLARKPLSEKNVAANVLKWGTGGLNIDGSRIAYHGDYRSPARSSGEVNSGGSFGTGVTKFDDSSAEAKGRFPANLILDEEAGAALDEQSGASNSRFFYCAKVSSSERNAGLEGMPKGPAPASARSKPAEGRDNALGEPRANHHPTVKPIKLMRYLCKLVTPPNGVVLDPFMGSGSTGVAAIQEGFQFVGIEREAEYVEIAAKRLAHVEKA